MDYMSKKIKILSAATLLASITSLATIAHTKPAVLQVQEKALSDYAKTRYPIVMTHGWLGWSRIGNSSFNIDYWYQILPDMARNG